MRFDGMFEQRTILLVEDHESLRESLSELLEVEGYRVEQAGHGQEAWEKVQSGGPPSVILLDLMMPVMDGWQFAALKEQDESLASVPLIVFTAAPDMHPPANADIIIKKPASFELLKAAVQECCRRE